MTQFKARLAALCGLIMLGFAIWGGVCCFSTVGYRSTEGVVISSDVKSTVTGRINLHEPRIRYRYVVQGTTYVGSRYTVVPLDQEGTREWADGVAGVLLPGAKCTVYYDPNAPDDSVLRRTPRLRFLLIALLFSILGLAYATAGIVWLRRDRLPH